MKRLLVSVFAMMFVTSCVGSRDEERPTFGEITVNPDAFAPPAPDVLPAEDESADDVAAEIEADVADDVAPDLAEVECVESTDCPLGSFCNNGQCMQNASPECLTNEDCGAGVSCECKRDWLMCKTHVCDNYVCGETITAEQCEFGCEGGQCLPEPAECEADSECAHLDAIVCDGVWSITVTGACYKGVCLANDAAGLACEYGCEAGACLPEPECEIDNDCSATGSLICDSEFVMKEVGQTGLCIDGICDMVEYFHQCDLPCANGCYECWSNTDCADGDECTAEYCAEHECAYENTCACKVDANCDDANDCTLDSCDVGKCKNVEILNCVQCAEDGICGGAATGCYGNSLMVVDNHCDTLGYCLANSVECEFGCDATVGCKDQCESAGDCADDDDCTTDSCVSGKCSHNDKCVAFGEFGNMKKCDSDADCVGTDFGGHCVDEGESQEWCQPCYNSLKGDADILCPTGLYCFWGMVGDDAAWASVYNCAECSVNAHCDDDNPCTEDKCDAGKCEHQEIKGCFACNENADCKFLQVCYEYEGVDTEWTWTGKCLPVSDGDIFGKCEIVEKKCKTACAGDSCEKLECESDTDCGFGQYCSDKNLCGWMGDIQCKFDCPVEKKFAVVWYGANKEAVVECGTGIFIFPSAQQCYWGLKNPAFKFNLWDGAGTWSDGAKAVLTCNDEKFVVKPDVNLGAQGVQFVTFTDVVCGF